MAVAVILLAAGSAAAPLPARASCARTATLAQIAKAPGAAVFSGRATCEVPESDDVGFAVDRWFHGAHAARVVHLLGWSAGLVEPQAGAFHATLARTTAGDAIRLVRDEPVFMIAEWVEESGAFAVRFCSGAGVPLDSPEGRQALRTAVAFFGAGRAALALLPTDTLDPDATGTPAATTPVRDWWPLAFAFTLATALVRLARRAAGRRTSDPWTHDRAEPARLRARSWRSGRRGEGQGRALPRNGVG